MTLRTSAVMCAVLAVLLGGRAPRAAQDPRGQIGQPEDLRGDEDGSASRFGRMFHLAPFADATPSIRAALVRLGARGGLLDARDNLAAGPVALIVDPLLSAGNPNNENITAGVTFLGQFLDHDMTFDIGSPLGTPANPRQSRNARRPFFDLDSVYGEGPAGSPQLFEQADRA